MVNFMLFPVQDLMAQEYMLLILNVISTRKSFTVLFYFKLVEGMVLASTLNDGWEDGLRNFECWFSSLSKAFILPHCFTFSSSLPSTQTTAFLRMF
jgi:hypothetical protein